MYIDVVRVMAREETLGKEALELPLNSLDLSPSYILEVAEFIFAERNPEWGGGRGRAHDREMARLAMGYTIADLTQAYESAGTSPRHVHSGGRYLLAHSGKGRVNSLTILRKLAELGLEYVDWPHVQSAKCSGDELKQLSKEVLLQKNVRVLNTLTSYSRRAVLHELAKLGVEREDQTLTISDLLLVQDAGQPVARSISKTRKYLRELGFKYEDGPLLQFGTRRRLIEDLQKQEGITRHEAELVARIARRRGWVSKFSV